ncbi:MAG TPA: response regulator transcription factor [Anaerolineales bacterium]|nr:response regulator transcription factor [Anaerolineales bacterium]HMX18473.1 response regulator transcription factor [Anaerolineales bacterium]HMX73451.1 response regulator transcription factor [Anaerolineales bacterium]HMZ42228.1 response regulator transcription factor [Anaerolineales bacterium]HNA53677.1 response regulator transcription factor [Anaerolineales bacterium]
MGDLEKVIALPIFILHLSPFIPYTAPMSEIILVVDDEPKITRLARDYLEKNGYHVLTASDGQSALATARREKPDLIVLDLMLPNMDGREVCKILRRESDVPIIMLTALAEEIDQVTGLEIGADDYITKPFSPRALVARVRALLRRSKGGIKTPTTIRIGGLEIDSEKYSVTLNGTPIKLTPNEFKLLSILASRPGQTLTREQLLEDLHGAASSIDRSVDSHIKNLRKKLEAESDSPSIETIYGIGYRFIER